MKKYIALFVISIENLKNLKHNTCQKKVLFIFITCSKFKNEDENLFREEESLEISKILGLIENI